MGERQNFYSLQLPEPGHILGPRDSRVTGLFIIRLAFCVVVLPLRLFFPGLKSLRLKSNAEEGEKKIHRVRCVLPLPRKGWTSRDPFFPLLLFSRALSPSFLPSRRVAAGSRARFLGRLCSPPPPHPSTFPPYGQAAEQRLGREGKQREANKPTPPRRAGKAPQQPSGSGSSKTCREISFPPRLPPLRAGAGHSALISIRISSFFYPPPTFFLPLLFLFHSAFKKKKSI